jgi:16S rRNA (cytidine1402-2'-O)-methyltransferase
LIDFSSLHAAAHSACAHQHYPQSALFMVATPIGNLADISLRAIHLLGLVDAIACEDTRHTGSLLKSLGLEKPLISLHQHNELEASQQVLSRLAQGQRVAYVSDAGTPGVSDPGARLVEVARQADYVCVPIPGASSLTALMSVAGQGGDDPRFVFHGFLPAKGQARHQAVQHMAADKRAHLVLESPHRIAALADDLGVLGMRELTIGRELTKQFESVVRMPASQWAEWLKGDANRSRGEFVVYVHPMAETAEEGLSADTESTLRALLAELPTKTAVKLCADITGHARNALYERALAIKAESGQ